jgi:hypothetical protein
MYPLGIWFVPGICVWIFVPGICVWIFVPGICVWISCIKKTTTTTTMMIMIIIIIIIIIIWCSSIHIIKHTLVTDIAVPLTHNFSKIEAQKITKYENLALEIKNIWKLNNVCTYPFSHLSRRSGHEKLPMISQRI